MLDFSTLRLSTLGVLGLGVIVWDCWLAAHSHVVNIHSEIVRTGNIMQHNKLRCWEEGGREMCVHIRLGIRL